MRTNWIASSLLMLSLVGCAEAPEAGSESVAIIRDGDAASVCAAHCAAASSCSAERVVRGCVEACTALQAEARDGGCGQYFDAMLSCYASADDVCVAERCAVAEETIASCLGEPAVAPAERVVDEPVASYPAAGRHLLTVSLAHAPTKPLMFMAQVEPGAGGDLAITLEALDAFDRESPVGDTIDLGPVDALESLDELLVFPHWPLGDDMLPTVIVSDANPLANEELELVDVTLRPMALAPYLCGMVEGELVSPTGADLEGSTFTLLPWDQATGLQSIPIDCAGNPAEPLSAL